MHQEFKMTETPDIRIQGDKNFNTIGENPTFLGIPINLSDNFPQIFDGVPRVLSAIYSTHRNFVKINAGAWQAQSAYRFSTSDTFRTYVLNKHF